MPISAKLRGEAWRCLKEARATPDRALGRKLAARALELAQLAEALSYLPPSDGSNVAGQVAAHRIYFMFGGHFVAVQDFFAESDEGALTLAYALQEACSDGYDDFELWQGARLIAGNAVSRRPQPVQRPEQITARMQDDLLTTEETLLNSRRAIAHSRKLLESTERLREEIGRRA
jgi:hypothetical protein